MTSGHSPSPGREPASAEAGEAVGPYRLVERLGQGGMGEVWLAEDPSGAAGGAPRLVAIKRLTDRLATDVAFRARFAREVAALRRVDSPYVAPLLDADTGAPVPWHASAYVAGPTLADHVSRHGPLPDRPLRALGLALAEALAAIHAAGVVHRDLTPRNIVLGPDGPRVVDFGIAWYPGAEQVTRTGASVGTPSWMPPERLFAGGDAATPASDVWSWGAVMAYAAGGPGTTADAPDLPGWLAPWLRVATEFAAASRPDAATLRAAMAAESLGPTDPASDLVPGTSLPATPPTTAPAPPGTPWPDRPSTPAPNGTWPAPTAQADEPTAPAPTDAWPDPTGREGQPPATAPAGPWPDPTGRGGQPTAPAPARAWPEPTGGGGQPTVPAAASAGTARPAPAASGASAISGPGALPGRRAADPGRRRRGRALGSAALLLAVAGGVGFVVVPLAAVLVGTCLVLVALVLRHVRGRHEDRRGRVPPTWAVTLAAPTVLGASLAATFGTVPGLVALAVVLLAFLVLAGDMVIG